MPGWPAVWVCTHAGSDATKAAATIIPTGERRRGLFLRCIVGPAAPIAAVIGSSHSLVLICCIFIVSPNFAGRCYALQYVVAKKPERTYRVPFSMALPERRRDRSDSDISPCAPQLFGADAYQLIARLASQQCDMIARC